MRDGSAHRGRVSAVRQIELGRDQLLRGLTAGEITQYLGAKFPQHQFPAELGQALHENTGGNPLFMVTAVDYLMAQRLVGEVEGVWRLKAKVEDVAATVPESLRQTVENYIGRLAAEEQRILEAASVVGVEFSASAVAAGLAEGVERVEERCEKLAQDGHFLRSTGTDTLPDGTITGRYGFLHALYQKAFYDRLAVPRRIRLHRRIGEGEEQTYGNRVGEMAAELALHFERGQDYPRAVQYLEQAGKNAIRQSAHREAILHLTKGLELLKALPDTPKRTEHELTLQMALGAPLVATSGFASPEVGAVYTRARELCQELGEPPQLFVVLLGLWVFHLIGGELEMALSLGEQLFQFAQRGQDSTFLLQSHVVLGTPLMFLGSLDLAREHFDQGNALYDPHHHHTQIEVYGLDPGVISRSYTAFTLMLLGYPDQARQSSEEALALARHLQHPYTTAFALTWAVMR